ncbi:MAG: alpha/beta hydrolase [Acidimicrobiales bacterium]
MATSFGHRPVGDEPVSATAPTTTEGPTESPVGSDAFVLTDPATGRTFALDVDLPDRYATKPDAAFPLVLALDGQWTYGLVRDTFRLLSRSRDLPEAVVVGLRHVAPDIGTIVQLRAMDFTPTAAPAPPETGVKVPAEELGGAASFRSFLLGTVLPTLEAHYRLSERRILVGHSFSALFGVDLLLSGSDAFTDLVLTSPSVWWDDRTIFETESAASGAGRIPAARVFLSAATDELEGDYGGHRRFRDRLAVRRHPGLEIIWQQFDGYTHSTVLNPAIHAGLLAVAAAEQGGSEQS